VRASPNPDREPHAAFATGTSQLPTAIYQLTTANSHHTEPRIRGGTATASELRLARAVPQKFGAYLRAEADLTRRTLRESASPCDGSLQFATHRALATSAASLRCVKRVHQRRISERASDRVRQRREVEVACLQQRHHAR